MISPYGQAHAVFLNGNPYVLTMNQQIGKVIILAGAVMLFIGIIWYSFGHKVHWIGRFPGDIRIEKEHFRFYFPITTMILISLLISLILYLMRRFD
jgi:hypothetical protein